jgi:hypothetical protein
MLVRSEAMHFGASVVVAHSLLAFDYVSVPAMGT